VRAGWRRDQAIAACNAKPGAVEDYPFGDQVAVFKVAGKMFALVRLDQEPSSISLKCDPDLAIALRGRYAGITAGYHLNKRHWNTVTLDGSVPGEDVLEFIDHSYDLVVARLTRAQRNQPAGRAVTPGPVAAQPVGGEYWPAESREGAMPDFEESREMDAAPEVVWRLVSDPQRLAEWVPTTRFSQPAGHDTVRLQGESHGHDYDIRGGFAADDATRRLSWDSPRHSGYQGVLTVTGDDAGSRVTVRVTIPDLPPGADAELARGLTETLDRIDQLTRS
jgi:predicted DNA-binding protein (MmcQ/YjbR family)/uncharacterized protein YndB with AHSA1/START domain